MLFWMDYNGHPLFRHFFFFFFFTSFDGSFCGARILNPLYNFCTSINYSSGEFFTDDDVKKMKRSNMSAENLFRLI